MAPTLVDVKELDIEWVELILEAKNLGISYEEIKEYINSNKPCYSLMYSIISSVLSYYRQLNGFILSFNFASNCSQSLK
jgi:hypothetical protein